LLVGFFIEGKRSFADFLKKSGKSCFDFEISKFLAKRRCEKKGKKHCQE
jgi:hypothetical protein